jgi:hypothetical protein
MIPGAGDVWDLVKNVVFISATFRMRRAKSGAKCWGGCSGARDETVREGLPFGVRPAVLCAKIGSQQR